MRQSLCRPVAQINDCARSEQKRFWRIPGYYVSLVLILAVSGCAGTASLLSASNDQRYAVNSCKPDAILVNPCRPWFGAAASGNPGAPSGSNDHISQAKYLETLVGQRLDIFRFYHKPGDLPLDPHTKTGQAEISFANRANTYIQVNWKPASPWAEADGTNVTVNAQIARVAANIKAVGHPIFLTIWHEPENDVSAFDNKAEQTACQNDPHFQHLKGSAGTPNQYKLMWQNVERIFKQQGVSNVVWAMNYMSYAPWFCLIPYLWPGNQLVNWVLYDTYSGGDNGYADTAGAFYKLLQKDSSPSVDFTSKPWGLGEFNDCHPKAPQDAITYFKGAETAFKANTYPRLKMYMVFADSDNNAGPGCLTNYNDKGQPFPAKQQAFNQLAKAVLNK